MSLPGMPFVALHAFVSYAALQEGLGRAPGKGPKFRTWLDCRFGLHSANGASLTAVHARSHQRGCAEESSHYV